jgi:hypothetical protein
MDSKIESVNKADTQADAPAKVVVTALREATAAESSFAIARADPELNPYPGGNQ